MTVQSLGYVVFETRDLKAWKTYATQVLGLAEAPASDDNTGLFRMDDRPFRLMARQGSAERFIAAGWEFASKADFDAAITRLRKAGVEVTEAGAADAKSRFVHGLARCQDPNGNGLELFWGRYYDYEPFVSPVGVKGFVTGDMGMGHVVLPSLKFDEARSFYVDLLGFADTDEMRFYFMGGGPDDPGVGLYFLHCNNPRHHSIALMSGPAETGLVHMMLETVDIDEVGRALDRAMAHKTHISSSLGRHTNDRMISFYMRTPSGFDIEFGCNGWQVDWSTYVPTRSLKDSFWGHHWAPPPQA
jgi:3,4-dihydroxy-9,10-secoandrosta-1,3,5(10)-triene-9,17-dione 4,5-dioxygenase